jgi:hypothetical protein
VTLESTGLTIIVKDTGMINSFKRIYNLSEVTCFIEQYLNSIDETVLEQRQLIDITDMFLSNIFQINTTSRMRNILSCYEVDVDDVIDDLKDIIQLHLNLLGALRYEISEYILSDSSDLYVTFSHELTFDEMKADELEELEYNNSLVIEKDIANMIGG